MARLRRALSRDAAPHRPIYTAVGYFFSMAKRSAEAIAAEFARHGALRSQGHELGWMLMQLIIEYPRTERIGTIEGQVLRENTSMIAMCRQRGFPIAADPSDVGICIAKLTPIR